jgi:hypothetical protein
MKNAAREQFHVHQRLDKVARQPSKLQSAGLSNDIISYLRALTSLLVEAARGYHVMMMARRYVVRAAFTTIRGSLIQSRL